MVEDDIILRQVALLVRALVRWMRGDTPVDVRLQEMDRLSTQLFGLGLDTLRRVPPDQLPALLPASAPGGPNRWLLAARLLIIAARDEPEAVRPKRAHAALGFIEAAMASGHVLHETLLADALAELEALSAPSVP